jgi:hypothetical protein
LANLEENQERERRRQEFKKLMVLEKNLKMIEMQKEQQDLERKR